MGLRSIIDATLRAMEAEGSQAVASPELREITEDLLDSFLSSLHSSWISLDDVIKDIEVGKWDYWSAWVAHFQPDPDQEEE